MAGSRTQVKPNGQIDTKALPQLGLLRIDAMSAEKGHAGKVDFVHVAILLALTLRCKSVSL